MVADNTFQCSMHPPLTLKYISPALLKIVHILHQPYHPKVIGHILKNKQKNKCVCIHEIIRLIIMRMKMKMKNRSHRYGINRPKASHRKYETCLNMMLVIFDDD